VLLQINASLNYCLLRFLAAFIVEKLCQKIEIDKKYTYKKQYKKNILVKRIEIDFYPGYIDFDPLAHNLAYIQDQKVYI